MKVTTAIFLDTRRPLKDNTYPVKLRLTYQRKRKYYAINQYNSLSEEDFAKATGTRPRGEYKEISLFFSAVEQRAADIIKVLPEFSFAAFERRYLDKQDKESGVYDYYRRRIKELSDEGRAGTAASYECSLNSLRQFHRKALEFGALTPDLLKSYERHMLANGKSLTSVGIYLRALRSICNEAIEDGVLKQEQYPFGKRRYQIPAGRNVKKALSLSDIQRLFAYEPQHKAEARARDLWLFSYLCSGANIKDICRLRYRNIDGDRLTFIRSKTERTSKKNLKPVVVLLSDEAKAIVERWGTKPAHSESLVFPLLTEGLDPEAERLRIKQITKTINKWVGRIAEAVGIKQKVGTYHARHSYATIMKNSGVPLAFVSESLGHSSLKTTENYLNSFEDDAKRKYANALTAFD